ncbi:NAD(P)/FAD-dependent oxidoreductase [Thalassotalea ganghwensis]
MKKQQHIAVIGAGIIGVNCAAFLQQQGHQVTLIDRDGIGEGCSKGNAGHFATEQVFPLAEKSLLWQFPKLLLDPLGPIAISPKYLPKAIPWFFKFIRNMFNDKRNYNTRALQALNLNAIAEYKPLLKSAEAEHLLTTKGSLLVFETKRIKQVEQHYQVYKNAGISVKLLDRQQTMLLEPNLNDNINYSLYFTDVGHTADPFEFTKAIGNYAQRIGAHYLNKTVSKISENNSGVNIVCEDETLNFDQVILATGAWSKNLVNDLGYKLPIEYERGYHLDLPEPNKASRLTRPVASVERKFIITPMSHGLRLAGTVEFAGLEQAPNMTRAHSLHKNAQYVLNETPSFTVNDVKESQQWMGFRPSLPDSLPVIGKAPKHNHILFALGHQHLGLTLGAITGKLIAQIINGEKTDIDIKPFDINRFN